MHFKSVSSLAISLASIANTAPTSESAALVKRDTCDMVGRHTVEIVLGSGGPGQSPLSFTSNSLHIQYEGGVRISPNINKVAVTSSHQTLNPDQTRLKNPITWYANFMLGYKDCTVEYNGKTYKGKSGDAGKQPKGTSSWVCIVKFPCEGGISPPRGSK